jgi:SAM-dependent methyltransferase
MLPEVHLDFGRTAKDYGKHRAGFPPEFFARLEQWGVGKPGQRLLDLGTGTGTLARGFAHLGCNVTGLDPSTALLAQAAELARNEGIEVEFVEARAENTGFPDASWDVVTAGTCWHWFDRAAAAAEVRRILRPGGAIVIASFDWLPLPGSLVEATEALIQRHNPAWKMGGGCGIHWRWFADLSFAGFRDLESFSFDVDQPYSHEAWRGRVRASAGVGASLDAEAVARFDADHARLLAERFPEEPVAAPHRVFALIGRKAADKPVAPALLPASAKAVRRLGKSVKDVALDSPEKRRQECRRCGQSARATAG